jgi:5,10-methylenetetrahydrofolate reductase
MKEQCRIMLKNAFTRKLTGSDKFQLLVEFTCPAGEPPAKIQSFLDAYQQDKPSWDGIEIAGITVTQNPSGVVTAAPNDVLAHLKAGAGLRDLEYIPHISAKGMNSGEIETLLKGLASLGVETCFVITGDKPLTGAPVFEMDSLNVLQMIRKMNAETALKSGPTDKRGLLAAGAAVGLAKYEEASCLQQLIKMEKKIYAGGADFLITNLIFDSRKVEDLFRYLKERQVDIPVFGNVFFLHEPAARRMLDEKLPGVYVSEKLYEEVRQEDYQGYIERAARQVAMWRDLGAAGVDLGNVEDMDLLKKIIDRAVEIGQGWQEHRDSMIYAPPIENPYYVYDEKGERTPLRDPEVSNKRLFMKWVHNLFFEPGSAGYKAIKAVFSRSRGIKEGQGLLYEATELVEYIGKHSVVHCKICGDCYLPENYFVCLMGECTKGLPNVPCGDSTVDGRCGVDSTRMCAGRLVYNSARQFTKEFNSLYDIINPPKDPELKGTSSFRSFFLGLDHRKEVPLIRVAELLHASLPRVKEAFDIIKARQDGLTSQNEGMDYLRMVIEAQAFYRPDFIDINIDDAGEGNTEKSIALMKACVGLVCKHGGGIPPCIDSSDQEVLHAGLEEYYKIKGNEAPRPLLNSANKERQDFVWKLSEIGPFNIVFMLMDSAGADASGMGGGDSITPESLEQNALEFFREATKRGFEPSQVFFDTTVIPLAVEFSRFDQPGFNYTAIETLRRIHKNPEMKGVNSILGITNLTRNFPPGRKIGILRAYLKLAMDAGLTAAIVDVRHGYGEKPPDDEEIVEIVRAFLEHEGTTESYNRMQEAYNKYKQFGIKKPTG